MSKVRLSTLENVQMLDLITVFNSAFADYFVKIKLNEQSLADKVTMENIVLAKSVGAFFEDNLVGFILIGIENQTAYNGGTGVLPEFRRNNLTAKMHEFIMPKLQDENIYSQQLEVITENIAAIKTYEKIGFQKVRTLVCFKGKITTSKTNSAIEIKVLAEIDFQLFSSFWNSNPSWQNSLSAIQRTQKLHKIIGAFYKKDLIGYLIYTETGRIKQFAVKKDFRRMGCGQTLFSFVRNELKNKEIIITNIYKVDSETISFLNKIGLKLFLKQFEMTFCF